MRKRRKIIILEQAINDLEEIWFYTFKTWSVEQADRYHSLINNEIDFLALNPQSGKNLNHLREGYYSAKVKSHFIFYRYTPQEIEIIRILHENMDIPSRLDE